MLPPRFIVQSVGPFIAEESLVYGTVQDVPKKGCVRAGRMSSPHWAQTMPQFLPESRVNHIIRLPACDQSSANEH